MPLFSGAFALDTESDVYEDGERRTRLIQMCPIDATSERDVVCIHGWDCWDRFFDRLEDTVSRKKLQCHMYNLGGYEFSHLWREVLRDRYEYTAGRPSKGQWTSTTDDKTTYSVEVRGVNGTVVRFTCDMRRAGNESMERMASAVRRQHPEWFVGIDDTKLRSDYHAGWLDPSDEEFEESMRYSVRDAYSQAMIARWMVSKGYDVKTTAPSTGLEMALAIQYRGKTLSECTPQELQWALKDFQKDYPPLDRRMQDIAEESLLGGFVWGETGTHEGVFTHVDYSSSYPYEYAYGEMFHGRVMSCTKEDSKWNLRLKSTQLRRWFVVSFDFKLRRGMMPAISGRECEGNMTGRMNKKMREGRVSRRLYCESYLEELGKHYMLENIEYHEMWYARKQIGGFEKFIRACYESKNRLKADGMDDTADYKMWKLFMNGGFHGKSITKTHRTRKTFFNGVQATVNETSEPKLCFMLGFTAMMNARTRLLRHCRKVIESGHRVMMCDTDSMVTDCSEKEIRALFGDWLCSETTICMEENLGRFEIETDRKALRKLGMLESGVSAEFQRFKCWGLKRYCEMRVFSDGYVTRKTAFAGMHDEEQETLCSLETDGTEYEWTQTGKRTMKYGATIVQVTKHMKAENVWDEGPMKAPPKRHSDCVNARMKFNEMRMAKAKGAMA